MTDEIEVIEKNKPGPKCSYESWMADKIVEIAKQGGHISHMMKAIGIRSEDTFHRWKKEIPEFSEAYEQSKIESKAYYETVLLQMGVGLLPKGNFKAIELLMHSKFKDEYMPRTGAVAVNITNNTLNNLSLEQLSEKINQQMELLQTYGEEYQPLVLEHAEDE